MDLKFNNDTSRSFRNDKFIINVLDKVDLERLFKEYIGYYYDLNKLDNMKRFKLYKCISVISFN